MHRVVMFREPPPNPGQGLRLAGSSLGASASGGSGRQLLLILWVVSPTDAGVHVLRAALLWPGCLWPHLPWLLLAA